MIQTCFCRYHKDGGIDGNTGADSSNWLKWYAVNIVRVTIIYNNLCSSCSVNIIIIIGRAIFVSFDIRTSIQRDN